MIRTSSLCTLALVFVVALALPVIQDEAYYWTWAQAPAWTYFDHPPIVAWLLRLSTAVFGSGLFGLRVWSILSMAAVAFLSVRSAKRLCLRDSKDAANLVLVMLIGSPMFVLGLIPGTPDPYLAAMTALSAFACIVAVQSRRPRDIFLAALSSTLLVAMKHYGALIALGAIAGLMLHPPGRRLLLRPACLLGIAAGVVLMSPWWVHELAAGGEASVMFQLERVLEASSRFEGPWAVPVTIGSLMGTLGPVTAAALIVFAASGARERDDPIAPVLGVGALTLLIGCLAAVWLGSGEANWAFPALVFALPLVASKSANSHRWSTWIVRGGLMFNVLLIVYLIHVVHPFLPIELRRDPAARAAGFDQIALEADRLRREYGGRALIAERYQSASLLRYHLRDRVPVFEARPPKARRSQYDRWQHPSLCAGDVAVIVSRDPRALERFPVVALGPGHSVHRRRRGLRGQEAWSIQAVRIHEPGLACGGQTP